MTSWPSPRCFDKMKTSVAFLLGLGLGRIWPGISAGFKLLSPSFRLDALTRILEFGDADEEVRSWLLLPFFWGKIRQENDIERSLLSTQNSSSFCKENLSAFLFAENSTSLFLPKKFVPPSLLTFSRTDLHDLLPKMSMTWQNLGPIWQRCHNFFFVAVKAISKCLPIWSTLEIRFPVCSCGLITMFNTIKKTK